MSERGHRWTVVHIVTLVGIRAVESQCTACNAFMRTLRWEPTDREETAYSRDRGRTWRSAEPPCKPREERER